MNHYIVHSIKAAISSKKEYDRLSDLHDSVKSLVKPLFSFVEGKNKVNQLKATYPELDFELLSIED